MILPSLSSSNWVAFIIGTSSSWFSDIMLLLILPWLLSWFLYFCRNCPDKRPFFKDCGVLDYKQRDDKVLFWFSLKLNYSKRFSQILKHITHLKSAVSHSVRTSHFFIILWIGAYHHTKEGDMKEDFLPSFG